MKKFLLPVFVFVASMAVVTGCKKNDCADVICSPCPSTRFIIRYQDTTGRCVPGLHATTTIRAYSDSVFSTPAFTYGFTDSCEAAFLMERNYWYIVTCTDPMYGFIDTVIPRKVDYQDPVKLTDCCYCYPAKTVSVNIDGTVNTITYPAGSYDNTPYIRNVIP